tara:strand:- start:5312 stop:6103 length:792 start_codon:yes stop_codon:yes gene_type:complete
MATVAIVGRGPSKFSILSNFDPDTTDVILMNDHSKTVSNDEFISLLSDKNIKVHVISNNNRAGFNKRVFSKLKIDSCILNRLLPDHPLWQKHKNLQRKNNNGGRLNKIEKLPVLSEDEPYLYAWRGPTTNKRDMKCYDGRKIIHMPDEAEKYLIPVYADKMICNCSYYASLYAILSLGATRIKYYGIDFYNHLTIDKEWYLSGPKYLSEPWWRLRLIYEGAHMKMLFDKYLATQFPSVGFCLHTTEKNFTPQNPNITVNQFVC